MSIYADTCAITVTQGSSDFFRASQKKKCVCDWSTYSQPAKPIQDPVIAKRNKEKDRKRTMEGTVPHLFNPSIYVGKFPEFDV